MAQESRAKTGAVQHLEAALATAEDDDVQFHLRQALQLLGIQE